MSKRKYAARRGKNVRNNILQEPNQRKKRTPKRVSSAVDWSLFFHVELCYAFVNFFDLYLRRSLCSWQVSLIWRWIIWWYFFICLWELNSSLSTPNYYLCLTFWVFILLLPFCVSCWMVGWLGGLSCLIMSYPYENFVKHFKIFVNLRWKVWLNFILQSATATKLWFRTTRPLNFKLSDPHVVSFQVPWNGFSFAVLTG